MRISDKLAQYALYGSIAGALSLGLCQVVAETMKRKTEDKDIEKTERVYKVLPSLRNEFSNECKSHSFKTDSDFKGLYDIIDLRDSLFLNNDLKVDERWTCKPVIQNGLNTGRYEPHFEYISS